MSVFVSSVHMQMIEAAAARIRGLDPPQADD
jgi:hypothetical protein